MKKILVPIDGSEHAKRAMEMAKDLAAKYGSSITLANVIDLHIAVYPYDVKAFTDNLILASREQSAELLKTAKTSFGELAGSVDTISLEGNAANEIIDYVNSKDFDIVVMGSHGMSGVQRFFIGSVANRVLHHIKIPILIVR